MRCMKRVMVFLDRLTNCGVAEWYSNRLLTGRSQVRPLPPQIGRAMPIKDREKRRLYNRNWLMSRKMAWLSQHGPCAP